jgi:threonine aldolase
MTDPAPIDLRSDTVTRPNARMRRAMAEAEVGDDVFGEDPTVIRLQQTAARLFGRPAALFVPTGVMGNLIALLTHTRPGQEVILERESHIYNYELGSMAAVAGVLPRVVTGRRGIVDWASIEREIRPRAYYLAQTALVTIENTVNLAGGTVYPSSASRAIADGARAAGLRTHLDGARLFNAAVALGRPAPEPAEGFDSVMITLSKGLGAPVGSLLIGETDFIERARTHRKRLGGGMRQSGVLAAAGLIALEEGPANLPADHAHARLLAEALAEMPGVEVDLDSVETNIIFFDVAGTGASAEAFCERLKAEGALAVATSPTRARIVTHRDVSRADVDRAIEMLRRVVAK